MELLSYKAPPDLFRGRVVLVTGAADGIGREVARALASRGAQVVALDRKGRKLETLYDEIEEANDPPPILAVHDLNDLDLATAETIARGIEIDCGKLDGVLHNAAELTALAPLDAWSENQWYRTFQINFHAAYFLTRALLPLLRRSENASVLFTSAKAGRRGHAYWGAYGAAYFALEGLMQVWSEELEQNTNIRMNSLDPGPVRTALRTRSYPGEDPQKLRTPSDITAAYLYLLGPDSAEIRGQSLTLAPLNRDLT